MGSWLDVRLCAACLLRVLAEAVAHRPRPVARRRRERAGHESPDGQLRLSAAGGGRAGAERARDAGIETVKSYGPTASVKDETQAIRDLGLGDCGFLPRLERRRISPACAGNTPKLVATLPARFPQYAFPHMAHLCLARRRRNPCPLVFRQVVVLAVFAAVQSPTAVAAQAAEALLFVGTEPASASRQTLPGHESILRSRWIRIAPAALARARDSAAGTMPAKLARPCGQRWKFRWRETSTAHAPGPEPFRRCRV